MFCPASPACTNAAEACPEGKLCVLPPLVNVPQLAQHQAPTKIKK